MLLPEMIGMNTLIETGECTVACQTSESLTEVEEQVALVSREVVCKVLDLERDLAAQELEGSKFDVIVMMNFWGGVQHVDMALNNMRKLLNPGGKICLLEMINPGVRLALLSCSTGLK